MNAAINPVTECATGLITKTAAGPAIEHADALDWLARQEPGAARAIVFDAPYSRYGPMRGREDGAAGSVYAPFSFMHRVMGLCARAVQPKGIVIIFCDWELLPDIGCIASICGPRERSHLAWIRSRPGGGGMFRGASDPVLIASRTPPDRVDKAAVKNWFQADYEIPRSHPYSKPPELIAPSWPGSAGRATSSSTRSPGRAAPATPRRSWACAGAAATSTRSSPRPHHRRPHRTRPTMPSSSRKACST